MTTARKRAAIFISGSGSNMAALLEASRASDYPVEFVTVMSDKVSAGGIEKARAAGVATAIFDRKAYPSKDAHEAAMLGHLAEAGVELICLAGFMRLLSGTFISRYEGRILNIHPSLLPLFPGLHTHQRAIDAGMKVSGCTVHYVTEGMDEGPVIAQAVVPVVDGDTADALAARVLKAEHRLYRDALRKVAGDRVVTDADGQLFSFG
jgi:phosphoribosylglycinamide formyltransferase-1